MKTHRKESLSSYMAPAKAGAVVKDEDEEEYGAVALSMPRLVRSRHITLQGCSAQLCGAFAASVTKNAPYNTVVSMVATSFADWSAYVGLYDEVCFKSAVVHWAYDATGTAPTAGVTACVAWDPYDTTASSGYTDLVNYRCNSGLHYIAPNQTNVNAVSYGTSQPFTTSRTGYWSFSAHFPSGRSSVPSSTATSGCNRWISTATSALTFGFVKPYFSNPASTGTPTFQLTVLLRLKFRSRNG